MQQKFYKKYFVTKIESNDFDLLIGNGFTSAYLEDVFKYNEFTQEILNGLTEEFESIKNYFFYETVFTENFKLENETNLEQLLTKLELLKYLTDNIGEKSNELEKLIKGISSAFEVKFSKYKCSNKKYKQFKLKEGINTIYSTNYIPDFNFMLLVGNLPENYINQQTLSLEKCNSAIQYKPLKLYETSNCITCRVSGIKKCEKSKKPSIYFLHGGFNIGNSEEDNTEKYRKTIIEWPNSKMYTDFNSYLVTAGSAKEKLNQIKMHSYTENVFEIFKNYQNDIYVVGNSLSKMDEHLVEVIAERLKAGKTLYYQVFIDHDEGKPLSEEELQLKYKKTVVKILSKFDHKYYDSIKFIKAEYTKGIIFSDI